MIQAVITDIEGTTSDIRFVHEVLFPYARQRLAEVVHRRANDSEIAPALQALRTEIGRPDADGDDLLTVLYGFMAEDRKSPSLKTLQGIIWRDGYRQGDFFGHVYDDVVPQLTAWRRQGVALGVYSSGSVEAQQLLFGHSDKGDLRWLFSPILIRASALSGRARSIRLSPLNWRCRQRLFYFYPISIRSWMPPVTPDGAPVS